MTDIEDVFHVPPSKKNEPENRFNFTIPGSKKRYSLPLLKYMKPSLALDAEELSETQFMVKFIRDTLPEAFGLLEDTEQLEALFAAWHKKSGVGLGESSPSPEL